MNRAEHAIANYLTTLRKNLKSLPASDCDEIASEIGAHLRDSVQPSGANIESVISHLGSAKELAAQYREDYFAQRITQAVSPWIIFRAVLRLAKISVLGYACFVIAFIGYATGGVMILSAVLKPFLPSQVGLWIGPGVFDFGIHEAGRYAGGVGLRSSIGAPVHEVLGWWYIPVALTIGALSIWITTKVVQVLIKWMRSRHRRPTLQRPAGIIA
ncbi:MAG: DUF1700 domain-containing protein [Bryobacteraceae bacterium]